MKKINIAYWVITILFAAFMLFSAVPDIMVTKEANEFMTMLGYPAYFTRFIGIAKVLGVIAILVPGYPRIKEWAYAGLFFDLVGATYSVMAIGTQGAGWLFMILPLSFLFASYILYHKRLRAKNH